MTIVTDSTPLKRGEPLKLAGTISGLPADVWTGSGKVRDPYGALVGTLTVTLTPGDPYIIEVVSGDTSAWPLGPLRYDIKLTGQTGTVKYTPSTVFTVVEPETRA
jgi:hypothetical protein